jgi:HSP20 family protein
MSIKDLVTRKWGQKSLPVKREEGDPFASLQREMNRVFENFSQGLFDLSPFSTETMEKPNWGRFSPHIDVADNDKEVRVSAELPGMDEKDVHVSFSGHALTITGEKKMEHEEKGKDFYRTERSYGSFHRSISLPQDVDGSKVDATFKKGVLTVIVPKKSGAKSDVKKIAVRRE